MIKHKELTNEHIWEITGIYVDPFNSKQWNDAWTIESDSKRVSKWKKFKDDLGGEKLRLKKLDLANT